MARVLYRREKRIDLGGKSKVVSASRRYYVAEPTRDYHCAEGVITKKDLAAKNGSTVKTNKGDEFTVFDASFADDYDRIERAPQVIPKKDIGLIITETGITRDSVILDSGTGSGGVCSILAKIAKKVVSYDIKDEHLAVALKNKEVLGLTNLTIKKGDITQPIEEKDFDVAVLDLGNPWDALSTVNAAVKIGGFIVSYSPTVSQVMDFVAGVNKDERLIVLKTLYLMEQPWEVNQRKVRPISGGIIHSGFLTFVRKIA